MNSAERIRDAVSFKGLRKGALCVYIGEFILIVNPTRKPILYRVNGEYEVYADSERASGTAFAEIKGTVRAEPLSVLLIRGIKD